MRRVERPQILLLDLGGVLADLGDPVAQIGLSMSEKEFWNYWVDSSLVRDFETGEISADRFLVEIAIVLNEEPGPEFEERFRRWKITPFPSIVSMLEKWAQDFRVALLSNTNAIHWQTVRTRLAAEQVFDALFLSFETGHFKPSRDAYRQVVDHYDCDPGDICFLDDANRNILAARRIGLRAQQVSGEAAVVKFVNELSNNSI